MEKFFQKHIASVIASLAVSGILGGITVTLQNMKNNELTQQRMMQLDLTLTDVGRRMEKMQDILSDSTSRQKIAVLESRVEELEKKLERAR